MKNTEENVDRVVGLVVWWFVIAVVAAIFFLSGKASADVPDTPMTYGQAVEFANYGEWITKQRIINDKAAFDKEWALIEKEVIAESTRLDEIESRKRLAASVLRIIEG